MRNPESNRDPNPDFKPDGGQNKTPQKQAYPSVLESLGKVRDRTLVANFASFRP
jgi:hypothetical protein